MLYCFTKLIIKWPDKMVILRLQVARVPTNVQVGGCDSHFFGRTSYVRDSGFESFSLVLGDVWGSLHSGCFEYQLGSKLGCMALLFSDLKKTWKSSLVLVFFSKDQVRMIEWLIEFVQNTSFRWQSLSWRTARSCSMTGPCLTCDRNWESQGTFCCCCCCWVFLEFP